MCLPCLETNSDLYGKCGVTPQIRPLAANRKHVHIDGVVALTCPQGVLATQPGLNDNIGIFL